MLRNKAVIIAVAILFVAVAGYNLNFFLEKKMPAPFKEKAANVDTPVAPEREVQSRKAPAFLTPRDKGTWKRDPFQYTEEKGNSTGQADRKVANAGEIKLQGITVRDGKYYALVNGEVVEEGDRLDNLTISRISRYSIFVKDVSGTREIDMYNDIPDKEK
jgi:hypothetical protein